MSVEESVVKNDFLEPNFISIYSPQKPAVRVPISISSVTSPIGVSEATSNCQLHLLREEEYKITILPEEPNVEGTPIPINLKSLRNYEREKGKLSQKLKFEGYTLSFQFKYSQHFEYFEKVFKEVIRINKLSRKGETESVPHHHVPKRILEERICFYEVPLEHVPKALEKVLRKNKKKKITNNFNPKNWNSSPPPSPIEMKELYDLSLECFREGEPFPQFFDIEVSKWKPIHYYHWTRHIFVQLEASKIITFYDYLFENQFYSSFQEFICNFFRSRDSRDQKNVNIFKNIKLELEDCTWEHIPSNSWKNVVRASVVYKPLIEKIKNLSEKPKNFDISFFLVLQKRIQQAKGQYAKDFIFPSLRQLEHDLKVKHSYWWNVSSCVDHLISLLLFRKPFNTFLIERYKAFKIFELSELSPTLEGVTSQFGGPVEWISEDRNLYIDDKKWQGVLDRFNEANGLKMELLCFEVSINYRQNQLRKKLREEHIGPKIAAKEEMRDERLRDLRDSIQRDEEREKELEERIEFLNQKMITCIMDDSISDELEKEINDEISNLEEELVKVKKSLRIYSQEELRKKTTKSESLKLSPPSEEQVELEKQILDEIPEMRRNQKMSFQSSEERQMEIRKLLYQFLLKEQGSNNGMFEFSVSKVISLRPGFQVQGARRALGGILNTRASHDFLMINNICLHWFGNGLVNVKDVGESSTHEEVVAVEYCNCALLADHRQMISMYEKLGEIAVELVRKNCNCDHRFELLGAKEWKFDSSTFCDRVLRVFGTSATQVFPEVDTYSSELAGILRKIKHDITNLRFLDMSKEFKSIFAPSEDEKTKRIYFNKHKELDLFVLKCFEIDENFDIHYPGIYQLLQSFDRSFWIKDMRIIENSGKTLYPEERVSSIGFGCPFNREFDNTETVTEQKSHHNISRIRIRDLYGKPYTETIEDIMEDNPSKYLFQCCRNGDIQKVREVLIRYDTDINYVEKDVDNLGGSEHTSPLSISCSKNHEQLVIELLYHPNIDIKLCRPEEKTNNERIKSLLRNFVRKNGKSWKDSRYSEFGDLKILGDQLRESFKAELENNIPEELERKKFEEMNTEESLHKAYKKVFKDEHFDLLSLLFPCSFSFSSIDDDLFLGFVHKCKKFGVVYSKQTPFLRAPFYRRVYIGDVNSDFQYHGIGTIYGAKGKYKIFEGEFQNGKKEGKGVELEYNKNMEGYQHVYEGKFKDDVYHGRGQFYDVKSGNVLQGFWIRGKLDEKSVLKYSCPEIEYSSIKKHLQNEIKIASGAYGDIYVLKSSCFRSLKNIEKNKDVAVKIMKTDGGIGYQILYRMTRRGIGLCHSFRSKHVLETYAIIRGRSHVGYVMKLCDKSVEDLIRESKQKNSNSSETRLSLSEKKRILLETSLGMNSLHARYVMHRDLKWGNVMKDFDGLIKLTDFDTLKEDEKQWRMQSFQQSVGIGTAGYVAPEVYHGQKYTLKCDVFAFGLMIYSLLWEICVPYLSQFQCSCGTTLESISQTTPPFKYLDKHVAECNLRPLLVPNEIKKHPSFLIDLMVQCWDKNPFNRPSFEDICLRFELEKMKSFSRILLQFPKYESLGDQKMYLIKPYKVSRISNWIEKKFETRSHRDGGDDEEDFEEEEDDDDEKTKVLSLTHSILGNIVTDEDLEKVLEKEENPKFEVELENLDESRVFVEFDRKISYREHMKMMDEKNEIIKENKREIEKLRKLLQQRSKKKGEEGQDEETEGEDAF